MQFVQEARCEGWCPFGVKSCFAGSMAFEISHLLRSVNMVHLGVLKGGAAWQHTSQKFQEDSQFGLARCHKSVNPAVAQ